MSRNWQDANLKGQGFSPAIISQLSGIEVDLATALAGGGGGGSGVQGTGLGLTTGALSAGDTVFTLNSTPPVGFAGRSSVMAIMDADPTKVELVRLKSTTGAQVTALNSMRFAHSASTLVLWMWAGSVPFSLWGADGTSTVDDYSPLQLALDSIGIMNGHSQGSVILDGLGQGFAHSQPLVIPNLTRLRAVNFRRHSTWSSTLDDGITGQVMVSNVTSTQTCTFDASTDTVTTPAAHGMSATNGVVFKAPIGGSLPTGITAGTRYFVQSVPTSTTFTLGTTFGGGLFDITNSGSGQVYREVGNQLSRFFPDGVTITGPGGATTNSIGLVCGFQQPSEVRGLRMDGHDICFDIPIAQYGDFTNVEINDWGSAGVRLGNENTVTGLNMNLVMDASANSQDGVYFSNHDVNHCSFYGCWIEAPLRSAFRFGGTGQHRSILIDGLVSGGGTKGTIWIESTVADRSYELGGHRPSGTFNVVNDEKYSWTLSTSDFDQSTTVSLRQPPLASAPEISPLRHRAVSSADATVTLADKFIALSTGNTDRAATLPDPTNLTGYTVTILKSDGGTGKITVATTNTKNIDGAASFVIPAVVYSWATFKAQSGVYYLVGMGSNKSSAYTPTNVTTDRAYDANATTIDEVADVLGTLIADLQKQGLIG